MADIVKDSYDESKSYRKVIFQQGRDVSDFELNELQDIIQGMISRYFNTLHSDCSYDTGWQVVATGAVNQVTVKAGIDFKSGDLLVNPTDYTLAMPAPPGAGSRVDKVYLRISEAEITSAQDSNIIEGSNIFSETALRKQLKVEILVAQGSATPSNGGGYRYYELASVTRMTGITTISAADVVDSRCVYSPYVRQPGYGVATGLANTYAVTLTPAPSALVDGISVAVKINVESTGASTLNLNGLGAKSIKDSLGNDITSGGLKAGIIYTLRYNATSQNFIVQGKGGGGDALPSHLLLNKTATVDSGPIVGSMPNRAGDNVALVSSVSGTTLKLRPPQGYYDGVDDTVTITDADFVPENIKGGVNILGVLGNMGASASLTWDTPGTYQWTSPSSPTLVYVNLISSTGGSGGGGSSCGYHHFGKCNEKVTDGNSGSAGNSGGVTSFGPYLSISGANPGQGGGGGKADGTAAAGGAGNPPGSSPTSRYGAAGGGSGGSGGTYLSSTSYPRGGAGGGNYYPQQFSANSFLLPANTSVTVTVGAGGTGGARGLKATNDSYNYSQPGSPGGNGLGGQVQISW